MGERTLGRLLIIDRLAYAQVNLDMISNPCPFALVSSPPSRGWFDC